MAKGQKQKQAVEAKAKTPTPFGRWFLGHLFSLFRRHGNFIVGCALFGFCFYEAMAAFRAFAGTHSMADLKLGLLANTNFVFSGSVTVSGLSIGLYLRERAKHRETRQRLSERARTLELKLDPNRTSSHLTPEGLTRKDDE